MADFTRQYFTPTGLPGGRATVKRTTRQYFMLAPNTLPRYRGYDLGANVFVTWTVATLTPTAAQTTPALVGTLTDVHVEIPA